MKVEYQITSIDSVNYITGWFSCAPDNINAVDLDSKLQDIFIWFDENGNPIYRLNEDKSIEQVVIPLTQDQITLKEAETTIASNQQTVNDLIAQILDYVVSGSAVPQGLADQWSASRTAIQSAQSTISTLPVKVKP